MVFVALLGASLFFVVRNVWQGRLNGQEEVGGNLSAILSATVSATVTDSVADKMAVMSPTMADKMAVTPSPLRTVSPTVSASVSPSPTLNYAENSRNNNKNPNITASPIRQVSPSVSGVTPTVSPLTFVSPSVTPTVSVTPSPAVSPSPSVTPLVSSLVSGVVINEIAWMGTSASTNDEWVELYNPTSNPIDLTGWTLKSKDGTPNINLTKTINPFGFYLLERTDDFVISDISADQTYTRALGNGGEYLELRDSTGNLQDFVDNSSGWFAGDNQTKATMEKKNPLESGSYADNWSTNNGLVKNGLDASSNLILGTPRSKNSVFTGN